MITEKTHKRECSAPCCFCGVADTAVETATTDAPMHRHCLRLAALGSLETSIMQNAQGDLSAIAGMVRRDVLQGDQS
jgi:hypothetical protein